MMLSRLTTELRKPASERIDSLSALEIVRLMNAEDATVAEAVGREAEKIAQAIEIVVAKLATDGRLIYAGAGTSGRLGMLDAAECPPTFGTPPDLVRAHLAGGADALVRAVEDAEDDAEAGAREAREAVGADDAVVGLSASGGAPYVVAFVRASREAGAFTVALSGSRDSALARAAELAVALETGPEPLAGSTRLLAGTAQKLALNALSTAVMVRL